MPGASLSILDVAADLGGAPFNYMSFSEDVTKFNFLVGGAGAAIPHAFSAGTTLTVGTKQQLPDIPSGEVGTGFTCTGLCQDPDSTDVWVGNFGNSRGGAGSVQTAISLVRVSADGSTYVGQVAATQAIGGLQGMAFVTSGALRCLAYVDGSTSRVCFVNRDGSIPRAPLSVPFSPNACAWDDARQALWLGDANSGDVWLVSLAGVLLSYADFNSWGGPLDHICVDASRGTGGWLWTTSGANGSPGIFIAWDIAKDRLVDRFLLDSAQAVEGLIATGTSLKVVTDGYFHSTGSAPNTGAPFNVNEFQTYTIPTVTQWRYARAYKSNDLVGPHGRQAYHLILDRGDSDTSADFCLVTRQGDAAATGKVANVAWSGRSTDPAVTVNMGLRLLSAGSVSNFTFGASYVRRSQSATYANGANDTQIGTRGAQTTDRQVDVIGSGLAINLGATAVAYRARLGA
jgi:hypothetical protein